MSCIDKAQAVYVDHMNRLERTDGPLAKKSHIDNLVCFLLTLSSFMSFKAGHKHTRHSGGYGHGHTRNFMCWSI